MNLDGYPTLRFIDSPDDLSARPKEKLLDVCDELRQYLLSCVGRSSGHLASGLGTVELAVALHYVYRAPFDHIIWDVGHQAYPHKILTGRRDKMVTIRQKNGLHPFPSRDESPYDPFGVGHSSTSISAGIGLAAAAEHEGSGRKTVAVIGDGAITAGMAFEAMNNIGTISSGMLVILNDNDMSISKNVGGLNNHLATMLTGKTFSSFKESSKKALSSLPPIKTFLKRTEEHLKGIVTPESTLFEKLGFNYIGPVDGHDVEGLVRMLSNIRDFTEPQLLHIITKKGKGYKPAEQDPTKWHGVPQFDPQVGALPTHQYTLPSYSAIFGRWLCETAEHDNKLVAITPAMAEGSGMVEFSHLFPDRFYDVAIAEQHGVTFAGGLAAGGLKPVVAIYSTFLQRGYDQLIHDIALQKLPVLFAVDRAGIVGEDGSTHQGTFDLSFLRCIPNLVIMAPSDENECRLMLHTGYHHHLPCVVRYPKGCGTGATLTPLETLPIGQSVTHRHGEKVAILSFGALLPEALKAAEFLNATVVDMRFVKPLDIAIVHKIAVSHYLLVTLEDNVIAGGAGSAVNEAIMRETLSVHTLNIGLPDCFITHGKRDELLSDYQLDAAGIIEQITKKLSVISQMSA